MVPLGAHVGRRDPVAGARERGAEVIQLHLSPPRSWATPLVHGDEDDLAAWPGPVFVHAPYVCNPASAHSGVRDRTRAFLPVCARAAARVGARGVVVHAGRTGGNGDARAAAQRWTEVLTGLDPACPILVEGDAGGLGSCTATVDDVVRLLATLRDAGHAVGYVVDTCHVHAAGLDPEELVARVGAVTGGVALVHANDAVHAFGSHRDGHANLGHGRIDPGRLVATLRAASAPVVVETPGGRGAQRADLSWLRTRLA